VKNHSCYFTVILVSLTLRLISGSDSVHASKEQKRALSVHPLLSARLALHHYVTSDDRFGFKCVPVGI